MRPTATFVDHRQWGDDWRACISWVGRASTGLQDATYTPDAIERHVRQMYRQGHLSVFEHWPITLRVPREHVRYVQAWLIQRASPTVFTLDPLSGVWQTNLAALIAMEGSTLVLPGGLFPATQRDLPSRGEITMQHHHHDVTRHTLATFRLVCSRASADQLRTYRVLHSYVMESQRRVCPTGAVTPRSGRTLREATTQLPRDADVRYDYPMGAVTTMIHSATLSGWARLLAQRDVGVTGRPSGETQRIAKQIREQLDLQFGEHWQTDILEDA